MRTRTICIVFLLILCVLFSGCYNDKSDSKSEYDLTPLTSAKSICNSKGQLIKTLDTTHTLDLVDGGIIYSNSFQSSAGRVKCDYYYFDFASSSEKYLGSLEGVTYIASDKAYSENKVYFLFLFGEITVEKYPRGEVWEVDLNSYSMRKLLEKDETNPYSLLVSFNNKLLLYIVRRNGSELVEYNLETGLENKLADFPFDDALVKGTTIRKIAANSKEIAFLIADFNSETDITLRAEIYDLNYALVDSYDLSFISDDPGQRRKTVKQFEIYNNHLYYQNDSVSFFGTLQGSFIPIGETDKITKAYESGIDNSPEKQLFYEVDKDGYLVLYLYNILTNTITRSKIEVCGNNVMLSTVFKDRYNNVLICVDYQDIKTKEWKEEIYYMNLSEIAFS